MKTTYDELHKLIHKVHESCEGRYDLTSHDEFDIHTVLCEAQDFFKDRSLPLEQEQQMPVLKMIEFLEKVGFVVLGKEEYDELEAQLKETKELTHRAINCADYVHISTIREIQKELLALESSPIEQSKQLDYTHIMKPIGNREPEAQKCRACEIEKNDEQVKQKPMHTCGKDGEIEKPQRKQPIK